MASDLVSQPEPAGDFAPAHLTLRDGRSVTIRTVHADDADAMRAAFDHISGEARYSRFMGSVSLTPALFERAVRPPVDRERALVAIAGEAADASIVGGARYVRGANGEACEFAITITDGWRGAGLASGLMRALIRDACTHGLARMEGYVLSANTPMLDLARRLGFEIGGSDEGASVKRVRLELVPPCTVDRQLD